MAAAHAIADVINLKHASPREWVPDHLIMKGLFLWSQRGCFCGVLDQYGTSGGSPILATSAASKACLVLSAGIFNRFSLANPRIRDWRMGGVE